MLLLGEELFVAEGESLHALTPPPPLCIISCQSGEFDTSLCHIELPLSGRGLWTVNTQDIHIDETNIVEYTIPIVNHIQIENGEYTNCLLCFQPMATHRICKACEVPIHYQIFIDLKSQRPYNLAVGVLCWYCADNLMTLDGYKKIRKAV